MTLVQFRKTIGTATPSLSIKVAVPSRGSARDSRALQHFDERTLSLFMSVYDMELWSISLRGIATSEPAIRHILISISTYHEHLEKSEQPLAKIAKCADDIEDVDPFELQHYHAATQLIRKIMESTNPPISLIKLASIPFAFFDFIRGQRAAGMVHLMAGTKLLELPSTSRLDNLEAEIDQVLSRMSLIQSLYGRPRESAFPPLIGDRNLRWYGQQSILLNDKPSTNVPF